MHYLEVLRRLHELLTPDVYLEIGMDRGASLALSRSKTVGIDPKIAVEAAAVADKPWVKLYQTTSDPFFRDHDRNAVLDGDLGLAFIDGMHLFEQVLRDLINVERWTTPSSVIVLHDVIPLDRRTASRAVQPDFWTGDVWKVVPCLARLRPDLVTAVVDAPPTGLLVIQHPDAANTVLADRFRELVDEYVTSDDAAGEEVARYRADLKPVTPSEFLGGLGQTRDPAGGCRAGGADRIASPAKPPAATVESRPVSGDPALSSKGVDVRMGETTSRAALEFLQRANFHWYQRLQLAPDVFSPGIRDLEWLAQRHDFLADVSGKSVLDIGTTNGAVCFEAERRGAARVVAVDIVPPDYYGFEAIRTFLGSKAEYVQASIYELPHVLREEFDVVFFLGVLYHLRHPLLALDNLRLVTREVAFIESEVADGDLGELGRLPVARFFRRDELANDATNWFAPTVSCLLDWCSSCGFEPHLLSAWPDPSPRRCLVSARVTEGEPEYRGISYERPVRVRVEVNGAEQAKTPHEGTRPTTARPS